MMPPTHYAVQDPYYNTPQFETYPAPPAYTMHLDGMAIHTCTCTHGQVDPQSYQNKQPNVVVPSAPPLVWFEQETRYSVLAEICTFNVYSRSDKLSISVCLYYCTYKLCSFLQH